MPANHVPVTRLADKEVRIQICTMNLQNFLAQIASLLRFFLMNSLLPLRSLPGDGLSLQGLCKVPSHQMLSFNTWLVQVLAAILENSIRCILPGYVLVPSGVKNILA